MCRTVLVIGIGAGDPEHLTLQAAAAIGRADVFFEIDKGVPDLAALRATLLARHARPDHRVVTAPEVPRDRDPADYVAEVAAWQAARATAYAAMIDAELPPGGVGAFLVWGDPALYDSTLRIVDEILARGAATFAVEVVPGISSIQLLAARHRIALHRVGGSLHVTTGRNLVARGVDGLDDVVVLLDGTEAFTTLVGQPFDLSWGAYLGTPDEILLAGPIDEVADAVVATRRQARASKGWIFDVYHLRRRTDDAGR